jgi:hypothetical protein
MGEEQRGRGEEPRDPRPAYEPPRIVWEELFVPETFSQCVRKNVRCVARGGIRT